MSTPCTARETLDRIETALNGISERQVRIEKRLFVDNGVPSIQTRLIQGDARMGQLEAEVAALKQRPASVLALAASLAAVGGSLGAGLLWFIQHAKGV